MVSDKDAKRIEEERAGVARPAPATLAPAHLAQALNALDDACSPESLASRRRAWPLSPGAPPAAWRTLAGIRQREYCCAATLFAACAAEAFVNDFLSMHLAPQLTEKEFKNIDRYWATTRKYVEAVEMAYGRLFWEGDEVMPHLRELFDVRNQLAHGRPGAGPPMAHMPDPQWRHAYSPEKVARWLVAVAGAAHSMQIRCYGFDFSSQPASIIWFGRPIVFERANQGSPLPPPELAGSKPLIEALQDEARRQNEALGHLRLTVHELREARLRLASERGPWDIFTDVAMRPAGQVDSTP
jgi:hypothetical protein